MGTIRGLVALFSQRLPLKWEPGWKSSACIFGAYVILVGAIVVEFAARRPPRKSKHVQRPSATMERQPTGPAFFWPEQSLTGKQAPDFSLPSVADLHELQLSRLVEGKPVVLVLASFSCDLFCNQAADLDHLYQQFKEHADFLGVYIEEAGHDIPGLEYMLEENSLAEPDALPNHLPAIRKALSQQHLTFPWVIDRSDHAVEKDYMAWPRRLLIVDRDGRIAMDLGHGFAKGQWNLEEVAAWLRTHVGPHSNTEKREL